MSIIDHIDPLDKYYITLLPIFYRKNE